MITEEQGLEYDEAMNKFYNSEVFEKLQDKETGLPEPVGSPAVTKKCGK